MDEADIRFPEYGLNAFWKLVAKIVVERPNSGYVAGNSRGE